MPGRLQASLREHVAVVRAVKARDSSAAEGTMRHHVRQAGIALGAHLGAEAAATIVKTPVIMTQAVMK